MNLVHTAYVPEGDGPFPTIVAIHGFGANANDLLGLAPFLHGGRAQVVAPQGPLGLALPDRPGVVVGFAWFQIRSGAEPPDPGEFERAAKLLDEFVERTLERYPVDRRHLVLLGFSQGGVMAYDMFLRQPERYAGLAALSSWLPGELAGRRPPSEGHKGRPVLVMHGTQDPMIPLERAQESRDALLPYGVSLTYREFEMGHEVGPDALKTLIEWLEEKVFGLIQLA
jgi:phospholipase/carboxylesterase